VRIRERNKTAHEKALADELLQELKIKPLGSRQGNPDNKEPDRLYRMGKKTIGIEVVSAYYTEKEAKATAEVAAEKPLAPDEIREGEIIGSLDDSICEAIQECLNEKSKKVYSGTDETWLCIDADAALTETTIIHECLKRLDMLKHNFKHIYVTVRKSENEGGGLAVFEIR
jgi:hypothetical protein